MSFGRGTLPLLWVDSECVTVDNEGPAPKFAIPDVAFRRPSALHYTFGSIQEAVVLLTVPSRLVKQASEFMHCCLIEPVETKKA